jgi:hypothetical protein
VKEGKRLAAAGTPAGIAGGLCAMQGRNCPGHGRKKLQSPHY